MLHPSPHKTYPVSLGNSLLHGGGDGAFASFKYDFKPQACAHTDKGTIEATGGNSNQGRNGASPSCTSCQSNGNAQKLVHHDMVQASVLLPSDSGACQFSGNFEPCQDGLDCAVIFDGSGFRLESLGGIIKTK
eukprot:1141491-Pelagomonas_calceolata.AAC.5